MKTLGLQLIQKYRHPPHVVFRGRRGANWWNTIQEDKVVGGDKAAEAMMLRGQSEAGDQGATVASPCHHTRFLTSQLQ